MKVMIQVASEVKPMRFFLGMSEEAICFMGYAMAGTWDPSDSNGGPVLRCGNRVWVGNGSWDMMLRTKTGCV